MFMCSKRMKEAARYASNLTIEEFRRSELLHHYNSLIDDALLVISNRNIHLKSIHTEFLAFSRFIMRPLNQDHFRVFLTPVFQHLYLLLISHKGKSDADKFATYYRHHLPFPPNVIDDLLKCKTCEDVEKLISSARFRVKLSSYAYSTLMNWLRDSFSRSSEMFHILRVLHENFHLDIYVDKDDEEFGAIESRVLQDIKNFLADYHANKDRKDSEPELNARNSESNDDDLMVQKMSELDIVAETSEKPQTSEMPETPKISESVDGAFNFELKSSNLKLRDSAKIYLEKVRKDAKEQNWTVQQIEEALLNIPDPDEAVPAEQDDQKLDIHKETVLAGDESADLLNPPDSNVAGSSEQDDQEMMDFPSEMDKNVVQGIIDSLADADNMKDSSPPDPAVMASPADSVYIIWSDSSTERMEENDPEEQEMVVQDPNDGMEEDDPEEQEMVVQDPNDVNEEEDTEVEDNDEALDDGNAGLQSLNTELNAKENEVEFQKSYKSSFHSAYPVTISGKDVLCSSDISSDLNYLACGFESLKICTWRFVENLKIQAIGTLRGHKGIVYALSIDENEKTLISGSHDCTVRIWDIEESRCRNVYYTHKAPVYTVCASPNSKYFLSAGEDKKIILTWYDENYPIKTYAGHSLEAINCVRFHPNCAYFASASSDGDLFLFKINDDSGPVRMFSKRMAKVYTLSFSPCGKHLAAADVDGKLIIWDILTGAPFKIFETGQGIRSISYDTNGSFLAALFYFKSWKIYNIAEENEDLDVVVEAESVGVPKSVHFSFDNKMLIIQYVDADKSEIEETKDKPKTIITSKIEVTKGNTETTVTKEV